MFDKLKITRQHPEEAPEQLLPYDVRFAIQNRQSMLKASDIAKLFRNGLQHLGFYMAMKASAENDEIQKDLLDRAAGHKFDLSRLTSADADSALTHLEANSPANVKGSKLHTVILHGVKRWNMHFTEVLEPVMQEHPESTLFMVANAPYVGLDELAALSLLRGRALGILKPGRFNQKVSPVGFMLEPTAAGMDIHALKHDFERPEQAIVFDDEVSTGNVRGQVMEFWGESNLPSFVTSFAIYNDARAWQSAPALESV